MSRDWFVYLPALLQIFAFFLPAVLISIFLYLKSRKDNDYFRKYFRKRNGIFVKFMTVSVIAVTFIIFGLQYTIYNGFLLAIIAVLTFVVFPITCLAWLIGSIVKYVNGKKIDNHDERKEIQKNPVMSVIVSVIEFMNIVLLGAILISLFRGLT